MQPAIIEPILRPDLGRNIGELVERVTRVHGGDAKLVQPARPGVSVGGSCGTAICKPFQRRDTSAAKGVTQQHIKMSGVSVGNFQPAGTPGRGGVDTVMRLLESMGATACRQWGAPRPALGSSCKELCGAIYPYQEEVPDGAEDHQYDTFAKVWFQPLFWVDSSAETITVVDLTYTGDPVFENGVGAGALDVSALFGPDANYSFVPGLPAFDNRVPLRHILASSDDAPAPYQGMFIGLSARN